MLSDLVALQLVDRVATDTYQLAGHVTSTSNASIAGHVERQLRRHVVSQRLIASVDREKVFSAEDWIQYFRLAQPSGLAWKDKTLHYYADSLRRWMMFAGLLDSRDGGYVRPSGPGSQKGIVDAARRRGGRFLGTSTPDALLYVLKAVVRSRKGVAATELVANGYRNAISDAISLGLVCRTGGATIVGADDLLSGDDVVQLARRAILRQPSIQVFAARGAAQKDSIALGTELRSKLRLNWGEASTKRYVYGLRGFYEWAAGARTQLRRRGRVRERD